MENNNMDTFRFSNNPQATSSPDRAISADFIYKMVISKKEESLQKLEALQRKLKEFPCLGNIVYYDSEDPSGETANGDFFSEFMRILEKNTNKEAINLKNSEAVGVTETPGPSQNITFTATKTSKKVGTQEKRKRGSRIRKMPVTPGILRLPLAGEHVLSMQGSPLKVMQPSTEEVTLTVPISNGRTIAISGRDIPDTSFNSFNESMNLSLDEEKRDEIKKVLKLGTRLLGNK